MTLKRLMIVLAVLVFLAGVGIMWLWQYAYSPQGRARIIIAQLKDDDSLRGWMLKHHLVRPGFKVQIPIADPEQDFVMSPDYVVVAAEEEMVKLGREVVPVLIEVLQDDNRDVRMMAIEVCGKLRDPAAVHPLIKSLLDATHDPTSQPSLAQSPHDIEVEQWCWDSLIEIGSPAYGPLLEASKRCGTVRTSIPESIVEKWGPEAVPQLIELLDSSTPTHVYVNSGKHLDSQATKALLLELHEAGIVANIRCETVKQLSKFKDPRSIDALARHLKDIEWGVAMWSASGLGEIGDEKAVSALVKAIGDPQIDKGVRMLAAGKAGKLGRDEGVKFLVALLKSSDANDRAHAAQELGNAHIKSAVDLLLLRLGDSDKYVRLYSVRALGQLHDPRTIPAVRKLLKDPFRYVRDEAAKVLQELGDDLPPASQPGKP